MRKLLDCRGTVGLLVLAALACLVSLAHLAACLPSHRLTLPARPARVKQKISSAQEHAPLTARPAICSPDPSTPPRVRRVTGLTEHGLTSAA